MPAPVRPKGSGGSRNAAPVTPMSERQQMALLMQLTSTSNDVGSRSPSSSSGAGARSRERNERGETPLHLAAIKGDVEQVSKLLAHRADPNAADFAGWTPLHEACNHGRYEVALRLVQSGANVNARGLDDDTPLHDAAANGHLKLARMLVERGADLRAKNSKGRTPLDVALVSMKPYLLDLSLPLPESTGSRLQPRARDDKKIPATSSSTGGGDAVGQGAKQKDETMDVKGAPAEDVYEFKTSKESGSSEGGADSKSAGGDAAELDPETSSSVTSSFTTPQTNEEGGGASSTFNTSKRTFSEVGEGSDDTASGTSTATTASNNDDESRRKKRKDDNTKEGKVTTPRSANQNKGQSGKQSSGAQNKSGASGSIKNVDKKSPCSSPKPSVSDPEVEDGKTDLKVPPLKIVIPQTSSSEQEATGRNGKNSSQRAHPALPYVVPSSNTSTNNADTSSEKEQSSTASLLDTSSSGKGDEKKEATNNTADETQPLSEAEASTSGNTTSTPTSVTTTAPSAPPVELHPRKRKMKQNKEAAAAAAAAAQQEPVEAPAEAQVHPHEQPITNCYKLFLNIRKQIAKRRRGLFPVQPKPPQGFKDYLMNRCTYVLAGTAPTTPNVNYPQNLTPQLKDIFTDQEKERYRLRTQHVIEKEKLVLSVEQEILRVHGRAARALANQSLPFSVCTILRDEEVYNLITPEQEEKDRNARSRYNGRLFLSWLQDVDDKWEKIKEHMLLRHHNEAESLHAVQKMDWEWKMKELSLCDRKTTPKIEEAHVPMVHVSDDFDLLPA